MAGSEWTDGLNCEMKGLDSIIGATSCEDIESEVRLVGRLWSGSWGCRGWEQEVKN